MPKINNDTFASKLVYRGLASVVLLGLMHSLYVMYHGQAIHCGENGASQHQDYINALCWSLGKCLVI